MTLYEFNALDESEQAEAIWCSTFIGDRQDAEHSILLYQIDSFYVEAYYHREHNVLKRFKSFATTELLNPYLDKIDISKLIE